VAVALAQEFKIVGTDRSIANCDHIAQRLDRSCGDRLRPILDEGPVDLERGEQPDLESMYELHHCVRAR
jgi:hypothetical protein